MKLFYGTIGFCVTLAAPAFAGPASSYTPTASESSGGDALILLSIIGVVLLVNALGGGGSAATVSTRNAPEQTDDADESDIIMKF